MFPVCAPLLGYAYSAIFPVFIATDSLLKILRKA